MKKVEIEMATRPLVGKTLWGCGRAADMATFAFGERRAVPDRRRGLREVGEYALHVQCAWRITREDQVVVGSRDLYYPADYGDENQDLPEDFDWDQDPNRRDKLLGSLFENGTKSFVVGTIHVGAAASLHIQLSDGLCLELFPDDSLNRERWRLFRPGTNEPHLVVTARGIET
jgi:hypothetical protein